MLNANLAVAEDGRSPNVKKLLDESANKKAILESSLLNEKPLVSGDIPEALGYITKYADYTSYHLLLAVRRYYPKSYMEIPGNTKAPEPAAAPTRWATASPSTMPATPTLPGSSKSR
jgi:hypothetical protein